MNSNVSLSPAEIRCSPQYQAELMRTRRKLLGALDYIITKRQSLDEKYWTIYGNGSIGAKAEELRQKSWAIEKAGFSLIPRTVLAMDFFNAFYERNGITKAIAEGVAPKEIRHLVENGTFSADELSLFRSILNRHEGMPLAIRSSAYGDCRGTGIYESKFCEEIFDAERRLKEFCYCIKDVLASHFSGQAIAFRKRCGLPDGIACMVEPLFGRRRVEHDYGDEYRLVFAPHYSGTAYTSTASGGGEAYLVSGLPRHAVNGEGMILYEGDTQTLEEIIDYNCPGPFSESRPERNVKYTMSEDSISLREREEKTNFLPDWGGIDVRSKPPNWLFARLKKLEQILGKPHYAEWAVMVREGNLDIAILQLAPLERKKDFFAFADKENSVVRSTLEVIGSGEVVCDSAVLIYDNSALHLLAEYNRTHKNYLVFYSSMCISSLGIHGRLDFSYVSNAAATVSLAGLKYGASIRSHFGGAGESAGMLMIGTTFNSFRYHGEYMLREHWRPIGTRNEETALFFEIPVKFLVQADENQRKAVVQIFEG